MTIDYGSKTRDPEKWKGTGGGSLIRGGGVAEFGGYEMSSVSFLV